MEEPAVEPAGPEQVAWAEPEGAQVAVRAGPEVSRPQAQRAIERSAKPKRETEARFREQRVRIRSGR